MFTKCEILGKSFSTIYPAFLFPTIILLGYFVIFFFLLNKILQILNIKMANKCGRVWEQ